MNNNHNNGESSSFTMMCCLDAFRSCSDDRVLIQAMMEDLLHTNQERALAVLAELDQSKKLSQRRELCLGIVRALENFRYCSEDPLPKFIYESLWGTLTSELRGGSYVVVSDFRAYFRQMLSFFSGTSRFDDFIRLLALLRENIPLDYIPLILIALARCEPALRYRSPHQRHRVKQLLFEIETHFKTIPLPPEEDAIRKRHLERVRNIISVPTHSESLHSDSQTVNSASTQPVNELNTIPSPIVSEVKVIRKHAPPLITLPQLSESSDQPHDLNKNNYWLVNRNTDKVIVFVHGIFSDNHKCWLYKEGKIHRLLRPSGYKNEAFWPNIVKNDSNFNDYSICLGGYTTGIDCHDYDISHCAEELFAFLKRDDRETHRSILSHREIVFIAHSTGGLIVRHILTRWQADFSQKHVGVILMASPSHGSYWSNLLGPLEKIYKARLAEQLKKANAELNDLHVRFKELLRGKSGLTIWTAEACEQHFIVHFKYLPFWVHRVVSKESAFAYGGYDRILPGTNHFTIVKPNSDQHPSHQFLIDAFHENETGVAKSAN